MDNALLSVKILELESFIDDCGHLFEQNVLVETKTGEKFWVQDMDIICNKEMQGKIVKLEFDVAQNFSGDNICKQVGNEKKIVIPEPNSENNRSIGNPVFYGEIIGKKDDPRYLVVDVGLGRIVIYLFTKYIDKYSIGDYIKINSFMVQLYES
ncbi:hypothetical protein HNP92_001822 [Methanococcus maripaludis]|uniref:Uncharacterized protein n=1 Tax=Methanococcus maripaludis TaxID=39152 RepID=A0A7J9S7S5_METMI|nr:hypothetical protein [Methanococcus maripaludis]MBB6402499.1 hypothetical protein [Methanococcus maripaludis]